MGILFPSFITICNELGTSYLQTAVHLLFLRTAKGVEYFKTGNHEAAMKYFEHALQIDGQNVEALVARGAL